MVKVIDLVVSVAQLVEPRIVIPVVVGSSPIVHPILFIILSIFDFPTINLSKIHNFTKR